MNTGETFGSNFFGAFAQRQQVKNLFFSDCQVVIL